MLASTLENVFPRRRMTDPPRHASDGMSGFLLVSGTWADRLSDESYLARACQPLSRRGTVLSGPRRMEHAAIVAVRHDWEERVGPGTNALDRSPYLLAADASLYYTDQLRQILREKGAATDSESASELILHSYAAFGADCLQYLEGDYAFALWDTRTRSVFAARDPFGTRSLYYAARDGGFAISSLPSPLRLFLNDPEFSRAELLRALTGYHGEGSGSAWNGVSELPAGWQLVAALSAQPSARRFWFPKTVHEWASASSADAALILRDLLASATGERLRPAGAAIGMSGGRDSTAIVGSVETKRRGAGGESTPPFTILSYRFPEGDAGNEDEFVNKVASSFDLSVNWIDTDTIPVFRETIGRADRRTRPDAQPFEGVNRALAAAARDHGVRVLLNGNGGDNLFGVPDSWLADLIRTGRWLRFAREIRKRKYPSRTWLMTMCLRPAIPLFVLDGLESVVRRRILSRPWEQTLPEWIAPGVMEEEGIIAEARASYRRDIVSRSTSVERRARLWALIYSGFSRNSAALFDMCLDEGVELRMPFYDQRVANFAWSRCPEDLNDGTEQKAILLASMRGVLPDEVLAARRRRTGTSEGYFRRMAARELESATGPLLENPILAKLAIVDPTLLHRAIDRWTSATEKQQLFSVIACTVESWLRAQI